MIRGLGIASFLAFLSPSVAWAEGGDSTDYRRRLVAVEGMSSQDEWREWERFLNEYPDSPYRERVESRMASLRETFPIDADVPGEIRRLDDEPDFLPTRDGWLSITFSPVHLKWMIWWAEIFPYGEVMAEFAISDRTSMAFLAGYGRPAGAHFAVGGGLQGRFILLGEFSRNIHAGLDYQYGFTEYIEICDGEGCFERREDAFDAKLVVGSKKIWDNGFTAEGQGGVVFNDVSGLTFGVSGNLRIGWSF